MWRGCFQNPIFQFQSLICKVQATSTSSYPNDEFSKIVLAFKSLLKVLNEVVFSRNDLLYILYRYFYQEEAFRPSEITLQERHWMKRDSIGAAIGPEGTY